MTSGSRTDGADSQIRDLEHGTTRALPLDTMTNTPTLKRLRDAIASSMELDPVPAMILAHAALRAGKPVTKRDVEQLQAKLPGVTFYIRKETWTSYAEIEWWGAPEGSPNHDARIGGYNNRRGVRVGETQKNARWSPVDQIRAWNPWAYDAADKRNAARHELLDASTIPGRMLGRMAHLIDALVMLRGEMRGLVDEGALAEATYQIRDTIQALTGWKLGLDDESGDESAARLADYNAARAAREAARDAGQDMEAYDDAAAGLDPAE